MSRYDYDIGIIGGGAAGLTVAAGAAQLGAKALLIEKEPALGGDCLHYGCVPSKTLIHSAHVYHQVKNAHRYGLPAMQPPPVDFSQVARRIAEVIAVIQRHDSEERFCRLGARVLFGRPRFVSSHAVQLDGKRISAAKWVIATGSSPAAIPVEGLQEAGYLTNREIFSLQKLPDPLVILGAGPIGIEMAQAFVRLGSRVTVIDRADQILGREDKDMADEVMQTLAEEGVRFFLGAAVRRVTLAGGRKQVEITDAAGTDQRLEADQILVAAGRKPNIDDLGLDAIGVATGRAGVQVDARLRTSRKHIFAAGDVAGGPQFTHAAGYMGSVVIANAVFRLPRKADFTYLPWCTYTDPELASIGMNEAAARRAGIESRVVVEQFAANDRGLAEGRTRGRIKLVLDANDKPLGVQILGPRAGDLIGQWVTAFSGKVKLATVAAAIQPYPTLAEINKKVAGAYLAPKIFSPTIKKGLKFFFSLKGRACGIDAPPASPAAEQG